MAEVKAPSIGKVNSKKQLQSHTKPIGQFMDKQLHSIVEKQTT